MGTYMGVLQGRDDVAIAREENRGLPPGAVEKLAEVFSVSQRILCQTLGIAVSTVHRLRNEGKRLPRDASESISRYVRLHVMASRLLRNPNGWFQSPSPHLGGKTPFEMANTEAGGRAVEAILRRLENGGPA